MFLPGPPFASMDFASEFRSDEMQSAVVAANAAIPSSSQEFHDCSPSDLRLNGP